MRVTQGMLSNNMLRNMSNSYNSLGKYMDQLATGKKINKPSDDPVVAMKGMNYRSELKNVEQYQRNISEVHNWMDNSDSALDQTTSTLHRLRELAVQSANGTYDKDQREAIAAEVDQLKEHLVGISNTKVNGKYIFNGTKTTGDGPVKLDANGMVISTPDQEGLIDSKKTVLIEVSRGTSIQANIDPTSIFTKSFFEEIENFSSALKADEVNFDQSKLGTAISKMDDNINVVVNARADLGARMNRLDLIENRVADQEVSATKKMSDNEDADMEKVMIGLTAQESIHRAALSAGARVIQPTLLDFLR
ncbi:flagellar hook-associated protein FlgL [Aquibacillus kalidii]|uniref:flagellar hook-associated protein FlgL n=1 Tax=Aquibacillus kalidii TaxID=2762597 RepID=UPI0016455689|nr:flagellar hook-associated protein FlgL [Aquibacillus kalidii]